LNNEDAAAVSCLSEVNGLLTASSEGHATLKAPDAAGAYRLFVYVTDGNNNVATANLPFFVKDL